MFNQRNLHFRPNNRLCVRAIGDDLEQEGEKEVLEEKWLLPTSCCFCSRAEDESEGDHD